MPKMKFEQKENMSRTEAAARLSAIADALGSDVEFELERGGEKLELQVPDQVRFELEVEIDDNETELEVEIKWSNESDGLATDSV
jgi:amphi-Trp domain-containing protein